MAGILAELCQSYDYRRMVKYAIRFYSGSLITVGISRAVRVLRVPNHGYEANGSEAQGR